MFKNLFKANTGHDVDKFCADLNAVRKAYDLPPLKQESLTRKEVEQTLAHIAPIVARQRYLSGRLIG